MSVSTFTPLREDLKRNLAARFESDRDAYTDANGEFIRSIVKKAADAGY